MLNNEPDPQPANPEYRQVILMRNDLNMRKGKMCAQAAHASQLMQAHFGMDPRHQAWMRGQVTKIVLKARSEEQLMEIYNNAREAGMLTMLITDSGKTEFKGVATKTCCAIGPDTKERMLQITKGLELM